MSEGEERRRRPDPARYGPNRSFSGAFRSDPWSQREDLWRERFGDGPERRNGTSAAGEGVRVGYDICEEQMRDGWRAAENYNGGHREEEMRDYGNSYSGQGYGPSYSSRGNEPHYADYGYERHARYGYEPPWRMRPGYSDLVPMLTDYLAALCATVYPGMHPHHHYHRRYEREWGTPPTQWEAGRNEVHIHLISKGHRSARATLYLGRYRRSMVLNALQSKDTANKETLQGYAETVDGRTTLYVEFDNQTEGTYVGQIVDGDRPGDQLGTLEVRIYGVPNAAPPPNAATPQSS